MRTLLLSGLVVSALVAGGCDFTTEPSPVSSIPSVSHLLINEVYTLPAGHPNVHSWVELYNPSPDTVDLNGWTLTFTARQQRLITLNYPDSTGEDTLVTLFQFDSSYSPVDVPLVPFPGDHFLRPGHFFLFVSNLNTMNLYFNLGSGPGLEPQSTPFVMREVRRRGASGVDTVVLSFVEVLLPTTDELILRDSAGVVVDVVRYGNYVPPGVDPFPSNRSVGAIPEYESIARYAGGYSTGSTADDFFVTRGRTLPPIPLYHSMLRKQ